jgi:hypothetical protein
MKKRILLLSFIALSSIPAFAQNVPSYVPSNGLVGWWPFNGNANDESGNGNHGTVNGATLIQDRFGNGNMAYSFDGVDDWIEVSSLNLLQYSPLTYSIWLKPDSLVVNDLPLGNAVALIGRDLCGSPYEGCIVIWKDFNNLNQNIRYYTGSSVYPFLTNVSLDMWINVVLSWASDGSINLYINGVLVESGIFNSTGIPDGSVPFKIGAGTGNCSSNNVSRFNFNGSLDDIGIWNRALTACEIQDLYHAQLGSQAISAGADQSICSGDPVTLNGSGGSTYQWNNNVVDGQAFTPNQSANYVLNGTDSLGCQGTDTVVVTVLENAVSTLTQTALDSYTLNGQTYTQSGTYTQTIPAANGCDSTITLNLTLDFTGIDELGAGAKKLVKITDLNGKIIPRRKNTIMLFIYGDGTVERVVEMEE